MPDQHLVISKYTIQSHITVEAPVPTPNYISHNILFLEGTPSAPYTMNTVQIKFVPDGQPLGEPSWQDPNLSCEKHRSEYAAIMDMVNKGIENKKPTTSFTATYLEANKQVVFILGY
ncbi:MAG: hypothetical protein ABIT05_04625 [Chitinophagaceae bacterium]